MTEGDLIVDSLGNAWTAETITNDSATQMTVIFTLFCRHIKSAVHLSNGIYTCSTCGQVVVPDSFVAS